MTHQSVTRLESPGLLLRLLTPARQSSHAQQRTAPVCSSRALKEGSRREGELSDVKVEGTDGRKGVSAAVSA